MPRNGWPRLLLGQAGRLRNQFVIKEHGVTLSYSSAIEGQ